MDFSYCLTKNVKLPVSIKISTLEGSLQRHTFATEKAIDHPDYYVSVQLFGDNKPLTLPISTTYKFFQITGDGMNG
ncbi:unnamed protein product [Cunninghamella echinulata]